MRRMSRKIYEEVVMKTTKRRNRFPPKTLFLMGILALGAVFRLAADGGPTRTAPAPRSAPSAPALTVYNRNTVLAAFNAATSAAQVKALLNNEKVFAVLEEAEVAYRFGLTILTDAQVSSVANTVWNNGANYASLEDLGSAIGSAMGRFIAG